MKNGNDNCNSVVRSHGKTKNENRSSNFVFNVVGKRKTKLKVRIPFSDGRGKRKTKLEVRFSFSHVVGKRLALRYTHYSTKKKCISFFLDRRLGEVCRQVAAVLFKIEVTVKLGLTKTSSTSEVCKWNKTFREKVSSLLVIQNVLVGTNKCVW